MSIFNKTKMMKYKVIKTDRVNGQLMAYIKQATK